MNGQLLLGIALIALGLFIIGKLAFGSWAGDDCPDCREAKHLHGGDIQCATCAYLEDTRVL